MMLHLPYPPLGNRYYRNFRGRMVMSKEGRAYKAAVLELAGRLSEEPFEGMVRVSIYAYRPRKSGDLDGIFKCVLDALQGVAYLNDKQIVELHAYRFDDKRRPRIEVQITSEGLD